MPEAQSSITNNGFKITVIYMCLFILLAYTKLTEYHYANFAERTDPSLFKLNRFILSSSRKVMKQKKKSLRAKKFV